MGVPNLQPNPLTVSAPLELGSHEILTPEALQFISELHSRFEPRRRALLEARVARQAAIDAGTLPDFLPETASVRESNWQVAPIPGDLADRRVEITGPVERKMIINALNSGANVFMADFEDSNAPTWHNTVQGQINLRDAVAGTISFESPEGKTYSLVRKTAVLLVRPRGWHLTEKHVAAEREPVSGSLFDFGLCFFHNANSLLSKGTGPYFYLPKMQSHLEARLWNDVFVFAQDYLGIPQGSIRATVLIETILAAFEMDEILHELRDHSAGLNCGRWDYIFSFIKVFRKTSALHHARPGAGHDDLALPELVCSVADQDMPSPRHSRHGRHGGADSDQEQSAYGRTNCAKCAPATMAPGLRIQGWCPSRRRSSTHKCRRRIRFMSSVTR